MAATPTVTTSTRAARTTARTIDRRLERAIEELLDARPARATICPSEAARAVDPDDWRELMPRARAAAERLVAAGRIEVTQKGRAVDVARARGPIRLRRPRST